MDTPDQAAKDAKKAAEDLQVARKEAVARGVDIFAKPEDLLDRAFLSMKPVAPIIEECAKLEMGRGLDVMWAIAEAYAIAGLIMEAKARLAKVHRYCTDVAVECKADPGPLGGAQQRGGGSR